MRKRLLLSTLSLAIIFTLKLGCTSKTASSQEFPPTIRPESGRAAEAQETEIDRILAERARLEAEFERLQAEYNLLRQQRELIQLRGPVLPPTTDATRPLPQSRTEVREGGRSSVETRILIYEAMDKVAAAISKDIRDIPDVQSLVIHDQDTIAALSAYRLLKLKIREFQSRYADLNIVLRRPPPTGSRSIRGLTDLTAIGLPTKFTRAILEFVALFRSEDQITLEEDFRPHPNALVAVLSSHLNQNDQNIRVYNPNLNLFSGSQAGATSVDAIIGTEFANLMRLKSQASAISSDRRLIELNQEVDAFIEEVFGLEIEDESRRNTFLGAIIQANQIERILSQTGAYLLYLDADVAGGSRRTRTSLFTSILTGSRLSFSGGIVINYSVLDRDGSLKKSNAFYYNTGYRGMGGKRTNIR